MPYDAYPDYDDLFDFLQGSGLTILPAMAKGFRAKIASAITQWETKTSWTPWLASPNPLTLRFDPPGVATASGTSGSWRGGRHLELSIGLLECQSVNIGVVDSPGSDPNGNVDINAGTPLQANLQYFLSPSNAPILGEPYEEIAFSTRMSGVPRSIAVTGIWGRERQISDDVWLTILQYAAYLCSPQLSINISKGITQKTVTDITYKFGPNPLAVTDQWKGEFFDLAFQKQRV